MDEFKIGCHYCKGLFFYGELTKDHVVPKSLGGRDIIQNIVPSCSKCNTRKSNKFPTCTCLFCREAIVAFHAGREELKVVMPNWEIKGSDAW